MSKPAGTAGVAGPDEFVTGAEPQAPLEPVAPAKLYSLLLVMIFIWAMNFIVAKIALREFPVFTAAFVRLVISCALLAPLVLRADERAGLRAAARDWRTLTWLSIFGVLGNQLFFIGGLARTSAQHAAILVVLTPMMVLTLACLRGQERFSRMRAAGLSLAAGGAISLALARPPASAAPGPTLLGDVLVVMAYASFAIFAVWSKELTSRYSPVVMNAATYFLSLPMMLPLAAPELWRGSLAAPGLRAWLAILYMAAAAAVIAYLIFYWALTHIPASRVSSMSYLQPLIVAVTGFLFLGERLSFSEVAAGAVVLGGVYLSQRR